MVCYHHGCPRCTSHSAPHPTQKGKTFREVYHESESRNKKVEYLVSHLEVKWECEIRQEPDFQTFLSTHRHSERKSRIMTENVILKRIIDGSLFGCVECDVEVPSHLTEKFSEFPPFFKNSDIPFRLHGDHMKSYARSRGMSESGSVRNLISSLQGEGMLLTTPLIHWYIEHGLRIHNIKRVIQYQPQTCFSNFAQEVSAARLEGAKDPPKEILAQTFKLWGNSAYGRTVMRKDRHTNVSYVDDSEVDSKILDPKFKKAEMLSDEFYRVEQLKQNVTFDLPVQVVFFVYQYAKLRMVQFYYNFIAKYVDEKNFQMMYMDTDSGYFAFAGDKLEDVVKPDLLAKFLAEKHLWLPRGDTEEHALLDKYTPGLFKIEFVGDEMICLNSKTYICSDNESNSSKYSCKGVFKKSNKIVKDMYATVLETQNSISGTNRGFRLTDGNMWTYTQTRAAFTYFYVKREVLGDGVSTKPLDL